MKHRFLLPAVCLMALAACEKTPNYATVNLDRLIVNEICPSVADGEKGWIEIFNPSEEPINIYGLQLKITDDYYYRGVVYQLPDISIGAGEYLVLPREGEELKADIKLSTIEEIILSTGSDDTITGLDMKEFLALGSPVSGGSWSRMPDVSGKFILSETATPGKKNYKFVPYTITGMVINEICPSENWVELYNNGSGALTLDETTLVLTDNSNVEHVIYTFGEKVSINRNDYLAVPAKIMDMKTLKLLSNEKKLIDSFSVADVHGEGHPIAGQSYSRLPDVTGEWYISGTVTKEARNEDSTADISELIINEFSPTEGWVEILNPTVRSLRVDRAQLKVDGTSVQTLSGSLKPGERIIVNVSGGAGSSLFLYAPDGSTLVDSFSKDKVMDELTPEASGSWSRIPDCDKWYTVKTASKNEPNYGIIKNNTVGVWYNQSATSSLPNNLDQFARLGIGHVFLHEYAFKNYPTLIPGIIEKANKLGIKIHIWLQCFWWNDSEGVNGWRSPVDDALKRYNQELFDDILGENRAIKYVKAGAHGIHFDYIRFGGTAYKHDFPEAGVSGVGAIDEFCRQASEKLRALNPDIILSAALMGETGSERYYGQHPESMGQYLDILIPMIYGNHSGKSSGTCNSIANYFVDHGAPAQCWAGNDTYDSGSRGLDAATIKKSCDGYKKSRVDGLVLFRYGLGTLPNLLDLKFNEVQ